jgi:hypothetical protein
VTGARTAAETTERSPSHDEIAARAHEIALGPQGGSDEENWLRAEHELRAGTSPSG